MNVKKIEAGKTADWFKWGLVVILVLLGFAANYYFIQIPLPLRMVGWLILILVLLGIIFQTAKGRQLWKFFQESRAEMRKVVWPTRHETFQTTLVVVIMVIILALFLWGIDSVFMLVVTTLTG